MKPAVASTPQAARKNETHKTKTVMKNCCSQKSSYTENLNPRTSIQRGCYVSAKLSYDLIRD